MRNEIAEIGSRQSQALVRDLANESRQPIAQVRDVYESQFHRLERQAKVKLYVPIFAARHAREILLSH
jgi:hypothetical protein